MSEETFRIVVTAAALIAGLAFVVEAGILIALFRLTGKMRSEIAGFAEVAEPVLSKVKAVFDKVGLVIERVEPALDSIDAAAARVGPAIDRFRPVVEKAMIAVERTGVLIRGVKQVTATASPIVQDVRSRIADISEDIAAIVRSGREQVEHLRDLFHDAGERARARLKQVDNNVEATVNKTENVSSIAKGAVLRPINKVSAIAAGISAAVSTFVRGHHKNIVDSATQDEETFI
jgi:hypothetical protein